MNNWRPAFLLLFFFSGTVLSSPVLADDFEQKLQRIEQKSASEKKQLELNLQRYQKMSPEEKKRYRQLHLAIQADTSLQQTFKTYTDWLETISPWRRDLLAQPQSASRRADVANEILEEMVEEDEILEVLNQSQPTRRPALSPEEIADILKPVINKLSLSATQQAKVDEAGAEPTSEQIQDNNVRYLRWAVEQHLKALKVQDPASLIFTPSVIREMTRNVPSDKEKFIRRIEMGSGERNLYGIFFSEIRNAFDIHYRNLKPHIPSRSDLAQVYRDLPDEIQQEVMARHRIAKRLLEYYWLNPDLGELHRIKLEARAKKGRGFRSRLKRRSPGEGN